MSHLLRPLTAGSLHLHNRLVLPPMATTKADSDGSITPDLLAYYDEMSRGGAFGLVITEHCYISEQGCNRIGQPSVAEDRMVEGLSQLADVLHANGVKAVVQISHAGAASAVPGLDVVGPSDVPSPIGPGAIPRPMTREQIAGVVERFAAAALRVKRAGFDGVELHAAHGYLLNQFFSPLTNRRDDEYGGDIAGRLRLPLQVVAAVRAAVGEDYPVLLRLGARDYLEGGTTVEDSIVAAVALQRAGVDVLDITGGLSGYVRPGHDEPGYFAELTEPIRRAVSIPVILTGGVIEYQQAETLLAQGVADLIGVGRAMLKDPGWARRAVEELAGARPE
ncbi:MAG: NADH:flavin oxidoreductase [Coriobacteriia bacterium]|nr:NADH:flavin oxidoreductase [Coriobacteriia bacterium]